MIVKESELRRMHKDTVAALFKIYEAVQEIYSKQRKDKNIMPSKSVAQQRVAGMAYAAKQGKIPMSKLHGAAREMAKMPSESLKHFAQTKHGNLPEHVKK